ncbi:MAG: efflux RND transporter permease subunit, partial [Candidatus Hydrogenedentes bacterium]|nr:efflux RND transporter permease subunit [Candidatus Hydrogenedentota bacterium]
FAFRGGVRPWAIRRGAGAGARHSIGTTVIGGMLAATFIATVFVPLFFVLIQGLSEFRFGRRKHAESLPENPASTEKP